MSTSRFSRLFAAIFAWYTRGLLRRSFAAMHVRGALAPSGGPVVYVVNHSAWWDPLVIFLLSRDVPGMRHYALMAEEGLTRYPFFARLGAVAVPTTRALAPMRTLLAFLERFARDESAALWIFPQGAVRPADCDPLGVQPGTARIARRLAPCRVVPIALRYEFGEAQRAEIIVSIGEAVELKDRASPAPIEALLTNEVARLRGDVSRGVLEGFVTRFAGRSAQLGEAR